MTWRRFVPGAAAVEVVLALTASAAGALVYQGFFAALGHLPALGIACLTGGVTAVLGHRRAWSAALLAVAGLALVIVFGVFGGAVSTVLNGLHGSGNRLLTAAVPADPWGELLVLPALVMWAAAFSSVVLVLRTRSVLAPLAPPLAGFLFALFVVGNQAGAHATATIVFLVAALALIATRSHRSTGSVRVERRSPRPITALAVVGLMVSAAALFGVVGGRTSPLASGAHRFDPRDVLAPPVTSTDTLTPLSQLKKQLTESPPRTLFTVRIDSDDGEMSRVRTAALEVFDGATWTSTDSYRVAGSHLSVDPALTNRKSVTAHIVIKDLAGPHLPVIGWPSRLSAAGGAAGQFGFDANSGVVVSTAQGLRGLGYDVVGEVPRDDGPREASPSTTPEHASTRALPPGLPDALREAADQFDRNRSPDRRYDNRLSLLELSLHARRTALDRPPGHSYAAITRLLTDRENGYGYAEQHASAFAVLARAMGFSARVAVGYLLRNQRDGVHQVTTADAHAWPEVHLSGYGWTAFEPTNVDMARPPRPPSETPRATPPPPTPSTTVLAAAPPAPSPPAGRPDESGFGWNGVVRGTTLVVPALVVLLVVACGFVVIAKACRRKRRRRRPGDAARVLGAWHEQLDRLTERGISPPVALTYLEVAQHVRRRLPAAADLIHASADLATTALYAPEHVGHAETEQAWLLVEQLHARLYPRRALPARLRAALDPRPLWTAWNVARQRRQARTGLELGRYR